MKIIIETTNEDGCNFDQKKLKSIAKETIFSSGLKQIFSKDIVIGLGVVSPKKISELNKKYRHKDSPTDILSFSNYEDQKELLEEKGSKLFLGDLIICPEDIENYAKKENISVETELMEVFSHGVLHLLGFSHGDLMFGIQEEVAKNQK